MRVLTQGYVLYPWFIKLIFISFFVSQLLANYIVVQRWILPRDIVKEVPLRTVTSCVMECYGMDRCANVGFQKDPDLSKNDKCVLVKSLRKEKKNGNRMKIFALVNEETVLEDEKNTTTTTAAKQQACPVDVNGGYGKWSNYTVCSKSCGSGLQYRNRSCNNPSPKSGGSNCSIWGKATESRSCNQHPCPIDLGCFIDNKWDRAISGNIEEFKNTNPIQSCYERSRLLGYRCFAVQYGYECSTSANACSTYNKHGAGSGCKNGRGGSLRMSVYKIEIVNGGYGNWSNYSNCSKSCGSGIQYKHRFCNNPTPVGGRNCSILGNATESRSCNVNPCPNTNTYKDGPNSISYKLYEEELNWHDAKKACENDNATLAFDTPTTHDYIVKEFGKNRNIYIGANDIEKEGTYVWADGTPVTTSYWASGQPWSVTSANSDCVRTNLKGKAGEWDDRDCQDMLKFLCQKKAHYSLTKSNNCTSSGRSEVSSSECEEYSKLNGLIWKGPENDSGWPKGCYRLKNADSSYWMRFNTNVNTVAQCDDKTHARIQGCVCKDYNIRTSGTCTTTITEDECKNFAQSRGLQWKGVVSENLSPLGCFHNPDWNIFGECYFNTLSSTPASCTTDRQCVCKL